ncbi:N-carbamoylputrescine amidase [Polymorphobacter multimanifer]|uniref:N-carbamoylputrescine amidase n=1 Tax=Polymorphobacter multimanifer TaxID=1070431 RepID=A0A841L8T3_9SPHN|nr:N-carbamoylputrescine amidase [Polymorphobacter multimanifer]MBB6229047.1 N-carbamoylputrescine amidase [Polymorphobacter multimanifer]GGI77094.1 N-carbamoylputrescine amidase [Polymorphobacter multimanifer]
MREIVAAGLQLGFSGVRDADIAHTAVAVRAAAAAGAQLILPPELFEGHYFCRHEDEGLFANALPLGEHPAVAAMREVALETKTFIPCSFFERDGPHHYNSLAMIDDGGNVLGVYRKSHIPDGPGYEEKFYFRPGNTGFKVWPTRLGVIGVGICWDQWYPETTRTMMLMGAEILLYPTAIGSEPHDPGLDTRRMWRRAMQGHAVSNVVPVVACNRVGVEEAGTPHEQAFYGTSFIADQRGDIVSELDDREEGHVIGRFDLDLTARHRAAFGFFRDRRPELYARLAQDI